MQNSQTKATCLLTPKPCFGYAKKKNWCAKESTSSFREKLGSTVDIGEKYNAGESPLEKKNAVLRKMNGGKRGGGGGEKNRENGFYSPVHHDDYIRATRKKERIKHNTKHTQTPQQQQQNTHHFGRTAFFKHPCNATSERR